MDIHILTVWGFIDSLCPSRETGRGFFYLAAAAAVVIAATAAAVADADAVTAAAEQQEQNDDPAPVVTTGIAHKKYLRNDIGGFGKQRHSRIQRESIYLL